MLRDDQQFFEIIERSKDILITFHRNWSGDAVASALALYVYLKNSGKNAEMIAEPSPRQNLFRFLPQASAIKTSSRSLRQFVLSLDTTGVKIDNIRYRSENDSLDFILSLGEGVLDPKKVSTRLSDYRHDLIIAIDAPDLEALGRIYEDNTDMFYQVPVVNIDHNPSNEQYGQINLVELTAVSASEIIFNLLSARSRDLITEDMATCLLAGVISETRSFKTSNITPQSLTMASQLMAMGGKRQEIVDRLYRSRPLNVLKLWGRILARLTSTPDNRLLWTAITRADFQKTGTTEKDLGDVIDELIINIPEARLIVLIHEIAGGEKCKVLVHSVRNINALELAKKFNPTGSRGQAEAEIQRPILECEKEVINEISSRMEKIPS